MYVVRPILHWIPERSAAAAFLIPGTKRMIIAVFFACICYAAVLYCGLPSYVCTVLCLSVAAGVRTGVRRTGPWRAGDWLDLWPLTARLRHMRNGCTYKALALQTPPRQSSPPEQSITCAPLLPCRHLLRIAVA